MCVCVCVFLFFFQAEEGIRVLVRSRGLGDVYKRQAWDIASPPLADLTLDLGLARATPAPDPTDPDSVSYTHLTLPPSDLV